MLRVVQDLPTNIPHDPADPNLDISGHLPNHTNDRQSTLPVTCTETRMLNTVSGSSPSSMMFAVNHPFLDITALIPSPDWLIGVDSLELCKDEHNEHKDNNISDPWWPCTTHHHSYPSYPAGTTGPDTLVVANTHQEVIQDCTRTPISPNEYHHGFHPTTVCKIPPG